MIRERSFAAAVSRALGVRVYIRGNTPAVSRSSGSFVEALERTPHEHVPLKGAPMRDATRHRANSYVTNDPKKKEKMKKTTKMASEKRLYSFSTGDSPSAFAHTRAVYHVDLW